MQTDLSRRLARNSLLQIVGKGIGTVLGVITVIVLTRGLGLFGFGEFTTAIAFVTIFAIMVDFGLTLTTVQMISEPKADEHRLLSNLLSLRVVIGLLFFGGAPLLSLALPYSVAIRAAIALGSLAYFFASITQLLVGVFQKRLAMFHVVVAELIHRSLFLIGVIVAAALHLGLLAFVSTMIVASVVQVILLIGFTRRLVPFQWHPHTELWGEILRRSWPIGCSIVFNLVYLRGDIFFLSLLRTTEEVGAYGAAYKLVDVIAAVPSMFMGLLLPILVHARARSDRSAFDRTIQNGFDLFAIIALPIAVGSFVLAEPIMVFVGGESFRLASPILRLLAPVSAVVFFGVLFAHAVVALNKQKSMVLGYALTAILSVVGYLILIPPFGGLGAAGVTLFSETLIAVLTFWVVTRVSRYYPNLTIVAKAALASLFIPLMMPLLNQTHVLIQAVFGGIVYFVFLTALGGIRWRAIRSFL